MSKDVARIYAELDMLLDTRLATLQLYSLALAEQVLFNSYQTRDSDNFDGKPIAWFHALYRRRDVETLKIAKMTNAMLLVANLMNQLREQAITRPFYKDCKLVVNFYPYELAPEEIDAIADMVQYRIKDVAEVQMIRVAPKALTPDYCKSQYGAMVMYNAEEWLNYHMKALEKTRMTDIMLLTPAMYHVKKPSAEELEATIKESMHPLQAFEFMAAFFIELKLIDVYQACIYDPARHMAPDDVPEEKSPEAEVPVGTQETVTMNITDLDDPSRTMEEVTIEKTVTGWKGAIMEDDFSCDGAS